MTMSSTRTFQQYQEEKREREWNDKVKKKKESMGNAERVKEAGRFKGIGNDKVKAGNLFEAREYYREAIIYVEDLVDARRAEMVELLGPLYANLAHVHLKLDEHQLAEDVAGKGVVLGEVPRNAVKVPLRAKFLFRRGLARKALEKTEGARDDFAAALKLQPGSEEVAGELAVVRAELAAQAKKAREGFAGFLNRATPGEQRRERSEEERRRAEEKRKAADAKRKERLARAEQKQQMQTAFEKLSQGKMLYEQREKEMEPVRVKELEKKRTLELERDLKNIIDDSKGKPKTEDFDEFIKKKEKEAHEQHDELDQKKKILDKQKKEAQWVEDDVWRDQRLAHRQRSQKEPSSAGPPQLWNSVEVSRWCDQRMRDLLVRFSYESALLDPELLDGSGLLEEGADCEGFLLQAIITDVLKFDGEAQVVQLNASKPALHYFDYFLKLDWEVVACKPGDHVYRTADDLITVAAHEDDGKAPPSVADHRVCAGTFKVREFCSEEAPADGAWPFLTKVKRTWPQGGRLAELANESRDALLTLAQGRLAEWMREYREYWHS